MFEEIKFNEITAEENQVRAPIKKSFTEETKLLTASTDYRESNIGFNTEDSGTVTITFYDEEDAKECMFELEFIHKAWVVMSTKGSKSITMLRKDYNRLRKSTRIFEYFTFLRIIHNNNG